MGTTYSNCQVHSDSQEAVVAALRGLLKEPAYVAPAVNGWVGVYPEGVRTDPDKLAKQLSAKLSGGVFSWNVYDSDVFAYSLYENGRLRDKFDSNPDCFEPVSQADKVRLRGKPEALVPYCLPGIGYSQVKEVLHPSPKSAGTALASDALASLEALPFLPGKSPETLLQALNQFKQNLDQNFPERYTFAEEQASDLAKLLGMDEYLAQSEYRDIARENRDIASRDFAFISLDMLSAKNRKPLLWDLPLSWNSPTVVEEVKEALDQGADPNEQSKYGQIFLLMAASNAATEVVQVLLNAGANVNAATTKKDKYGYDDPGTTALIAATRGGANSEMGPGAANSAPQLKTVQILLDAGADVNAKSESGLTALKEAQTRLRGFSSQKSDRWYSEDVIAECVVRNTKLVEMLRPAGATE